MSNDNYRRAAMKPLYDSDADLDEETKKKIKDAGSESDKANEYRKEGWDKASPFTKINSLLKDVYYGDKRAKK